MTKLKRERQYRELREEEFGTDGLPRSELFGPFERQYTESFGGLVTRVLGLTCPPLWLARYHGLPAYLGVGRTLDEAASALQQKFAARPVYVTPRPHVGTEALGKLAQRTVSANNAAAQIFDGKFSDYIVGDIAKKYGVRKDTVRIQAKKYKENSLAGAKKRSLLKSIDKLDQETIWDMPQINEIEGANDISLLAISEIIVALKYEGLEPKPGSWREVGDAFTTGFLKVAFESVHPWFLERCMTLDHAPRSVKDKFPDLGS